MFRRVIEEMRPYVPGEQPRSGKHLIKLNTNENPYPPSPHVRRALARATTCRELRLYPPPRADEFVARAARVYKMRPNMILAGNGSDELLAMLFRAALGRGDKVAYAVPTYSLYDTLAAIQEAIVVAIPYGRDFILPAEELVAARAKLTIACNPNSPSGTFTETSALQGLAERLKPGILAIDEAYVDFAPDNALRLVKHHSNVIVLRSLSKSFSLAGMRLGLAFARPPIVETLIKVKDSYNLSRMATMAGAAALDDIEWMRRNVARVMRARAMTERVLRKLRFEVPASAANFVLARMAGKDLSSLAAALRRRGILVRHFATPELRDALRITIGARSEMAVLFKALEALTARAPQIEGPPQG